MENIKSAEAGEKFEFSFKFIKKTSNNFRERLAKRGKNFNCSHLPQTFLSLGSSNATKKL